MAGHGGKREGAGRKPNQLTDAELAVRDLGRGKLYEKLPDLMERAIAIALGEIPVPAGNDVKLLMTLVQMGVGRPAEIQAPALAPPPLKVIFENQTDPRQLAEGVKQGVLDAANTMRRGAETGPETSREIGAPARLPRAHESDGRLARAVRVNTHPE